MRSKYVRQQFFQEVFPYAPWLAFSKYIRDFF